jgi:hypothetical protein
MQVRVISQKEHPVAYFFGTTETQQEIFGRVSLLNRVFGTGAVSKYNPTGHMGFVFSVLLLILFFPLLLLGHPRQLPALQIISFVLLVIEIDRYQKGKAFDYEWKVVLAAVTVIGWIVLLHGIL